MITAVVGVGVYTFHPNPGEETQDQIQALYDERAAIDGCNSPTPNECRTWNQLTAAERARTKAIDAQVTTLQRAAEEKSSQWRMSTSVILIVIATMLMAVALALGDSVSVLSNGILLGGLFTMLYGVGWGLASGQLGHPVPRPRRGAGGVAGAGVPEVRPRPATGSRGRAAPGRMPAPAQASARLAAVLGGGGRAQLPGGGLERRLAAAAAASGCDDAGGAITARAGLPPTPTREGSGRPATRGAPTGRAAS